MLHLKLRHLSNFGKLSQVFYNGDYFHEIIEGRNTRDNSSLDDETERKDTSGQADSNPTTDNNSVNVLLVSLFIAAITSFY
jgi:hypothetical protein